jgi:hypothetical protein
VSYRNKNKILLERLVSVLTGSLCKLGLNAYLVASWLLEGTFLDRRKGISQQRGVSFPQMGEKTFRRTDEIRTTSLLSRLANNDGSGIMSAGSIRY